MSSKFDFSDDSLKVANYDAEPIKMRNPLTNRMIKVEGYTYNKLARSRELTVLPRHRIKPDRVQYHMNKMRKKLKLGGQGWTSIKLIQKRLRKKFKKGPVRKMVIHWKAKSVLIDEGGATDYSNYAWHTVTLKVTLPERMLRKTNKQTGKDEVNREGIKWLRRLGMLYIDREINENPHEGTHRMVKEISGSAILIKPMKQKAVTMKLNKMSIKYLDQFNDYVIPQRDGTCAHDYIFEKLKMYYKHLTRKEYERDVMAITNKCINEGLNVNDIERIQDKYRVLGCFAFNAYRKLFFKQVAKRHRESINLVFMQNNGHLYPLTNHQLEHSIPNRKTEHLDAMLGIEEIDLRFGRDDFCSYPNIDAEKKIVVVDGSDYRLVDDVMTTVMKETQSFVKYKCSGNGDVLAFEHPDTHQIYIQDNKMDMRMGICDSAFKCFPNENFIFRNQGFGSIGYSLVERVVGKIPKNRYFEQTRDIIDKYFPRALVQNLCIDGRYRNDVYDKGDIKAFDVCKDYSHVMRNNTARIPIYTVFDQVKKYKGSDIKCGEYYIEKVDLPYHSYYVGDPTTVRKEKEPGKHLSIGGCFYTHDLIHYLLNEGYIRKDNIKYELVAGEYMKGNTLAPFVEWCYNHLTIKQAKLVVNATTGMFNSNYNKTFESAISNDYDTVMSLYHLDPDNTEISAINNDTYYISRTIKERKLTDYSSLYRHIICGGIKNALQLIKKCYGRRSRLLSIKTDCVEIYCPKSDFEVFDMEGWNVLETLGKYRYEYDYKPPFFTRHDEKMEKMRLNEFPIRNGKGVMVTGIAGSGKTMRAKEMYDTHNQPLALTTTCKAVAVLLKRGISTAKTLASYLHGNNYDNLNIHNLASNDVLIIDEFSMIEDRYWEMIYFATLKNRDMKVCLFGDPSQCQAVVGRKVFFPATSIRNQMCPEVIKLEYYEGSGRYDLKLKDIILHLLKTGTLNHKFPRIDKPLYKNISWTNRTRKKVNQVCAEYYIKKRQCKKIVKVNFKYNNSCEMYPIGVGMPLICSVNDRTRGIIKNEQYSLDRLCGDGKTLQFVVNKQSFTIMEFQNSFNLAFCVTAHRMQGDDIDEPYAIWDAFRMSLNNIYVAISRSTHSKYVHINGRIRKQYTFEKLTDTAIQVKPAHNQYNNGSIYEIKAKVGDFTYHYVGSTVNGLKHRLKEHKTDPTSAVYPLSEYHPTIRLITMWKCNSLRELEAKEKEYINQYVREYGRDMVLNKKLVEDIKEELERIVPRVIEFRVKTIIIKDDGHRLRARLKDSDIRVKYGKLHTKDQARKLILQKVHNQIQYGDKIVVRFD